MLLNKLIAAAGVAGTLGAAAPAFADWYQPGPQPVAVLPPAPVYGMPVRRDWDRDGDEYAGWHRRHEAWERYRAWQRYEWMRHHRRGYGYYQNW